MKRMIAAAILCACLAAPAWADMYQFQCITSGATATQIDAASQFTLDVSSVSTNPAKVEFKFGNDVGYKSSIMQVYFYDGVLVNFQQVALGQSTGVDFGDDSATPGHLPGWSPSGVLYAVDGEGNPTNGVDAKGEWISFTYTLQSGKTFADVVDGLRDGVIVVGIHVQAWEPGAGDSASYIASVVPVPGAALLGMLGLGAAGMRLRRRA